MQFIYRITALDIFKWRWKLIKSLIIFFLFVFFHQVIIHSFVQSIFPLISHYQNATEENYPLKKRELCCITRTSTMTHSISLIKVEKCFNEFLLVTMNMKNEQNKKKTEQKSLQEIEMNYIVFAFFYCVYLRSRLKMKNSI